MALFRATKFSKKRIHNAYIVDPPPEVKSDAQILPVCGGTVTVCEISLHCARMFWIVLTVKVRV